MRPTIAALHLGMTMTLAACTSIQTTMPQTTGAGTFLNYYRQLATAAPGEQRRAFEEAQAAYEKLPDDTSRLRLALVLLLPKAPWRDDARVLQLLGSADSTATEGRDLALLLETMLTERTRLLREEVRKAELLQLKFEAYRDDHKRIEILQQRMETLREECKRADVLQQKLEGLRAIDRERRRASPTRSTP